jgi:VanZ family protein
MITIFIVSSRPAPEVIRHQYVPLQDKWLHLAAYFVLAVLFLRALLWRGWGWEKKTYLFAATLSTLYGLSDEIHQSFVPSRSADAADLIADMAGAFLLVLVAGWLRELIEWERGLWRIG